MACHKPGFTVSAVTRVAVCDLYLNLIYFHPFYVPKEGLSVCRCEWACAHTCAITPPLISGFISCCLHIDSEPWNLTTPHCPIVSPATDANSSPSWWNHVTYIMRGQTSCTICQCYILWWIFNSCPCNCCECTNCKPQSLHITVALLFLLLFIMACCPWCWSNCSMLLFYWLYYLVQYFSDKTPLYLLSDSRHRYRKWLLF